MLTSQVNIEKIDTINFFSYLSTATSQQTDTEEIGVQFVNLKSANNLWEIDLEKIREWESGDLR